MGYVAEFLKNPEEFVRKVLSRELDENNDFADFDPDKKRAEIRDELLKLGEEQAQAKRAARRAKKKAAQEARDTSASAQSKDDGAADAANGGQDDEVVPADEQQTETDATTPAEDAPATNRSSIAETFLQGIREAAAGPDS